MPRLTKKMLAGVSAAELRRLAVLKGKIEKLEAEKKKFESQLAKVDKELTRLMGGGSIAKPRKKAARKKTARKKPVKKKVAAKSPASKKKVVSKKTTKKKVRKAPAKRAAKGAKVTLEDVVVKVIKAGGNKMAFQDIKKTIQSKKLFKTKAKNFDNVLRRTISTAKGLKRVGRGIYSAK